MDAEKVKELFEYDPETGVFRWRINISCHRRGSIAGTLSLLGKRRYLVIRYEGKEYRAHRLAFLWMVGRWPEAEVDHANGVGVDNRWVNLREATKSQNAANRGAMRTNKIGLKGVIRVIRFGVAKYEARIRVSGKQRHLGRFNTAYEAHQAYIVAAERTHGEFARS